MSLFIYVLVFLIVFYWIVDNKIEKYRLTNRKSQIMRFDTSDYLEQIIGTKYIIENGEKETSINGSKKIIRINEKESKSKQLKTLHKVLLKLKKHEREEMVKSSSTLSFLIKPFLRETIIVVFPSLLFVNLFLQHNQFTMVLVTIYGLLVLFYYLTEWKTNKKVLVEIEEILNKSNDLNMEKEHYIKLLKVKNNAKMFTYFFFKERAL